MEGNKMKTNQLWQLLNSEVNDMDSNKSNEQTNKPIITPVELMGTHRTGTLENISKRIIIDVLGFEPNSEDDPDKVVSSWTFEVDGKPAAIWDYKGSHLRGVYSTYDPHKVLGEVFESKFMGGF
jgi:hypothetical protein